MAFMSMAFSCVTLTVVPFYVSPVPIRVQMPSLHFRFVAAAATLSVRHRSQILRMLVTRSLRQCLAFGAWLLDFGALRQAREL